MSPLNEKTIRYMQENRNFRIVDCNLPDVPFLRSITVPREQLIRFRNQLLMLADFAAYQCGVTIDELTPLHLFMKMLRDYKDEHEKEKHT